MHERITLAITQALSALGAQGISFVVERPADMSHGDFATNAALSAAKTLGKNPREVAAALQSKLSIEGVERTDVAGPGFINFFLSREALKREVERAATEDTWGNNALYQGKRVMVEYTDPNPFKEFHIGHLMSNTIGEAIARTLEAAGASVVRANYQGDVGLHVAKAIYGLEQMGGDPMSEGKLGMAYVLGAEKYEADPAAKERIHEINKHVYLQDDESIQKLYREGKEVSLRRFENLYKILGTTFNYYFFESETTPIGLELVRKHTGDVFEESEGAVVYKGEKVGLHTRVFINAQGLPTYEAKDIGLLSMKQEKEAALDQSITITASEQNDYFKVVLAAAKEIPEVATIAQKTTHISHGMMRFAEGKMSSRRGNVITGASLLGDLTIASHQKMQGRELVDANNTAQQVAVAAIKYAVLKQGSGKDIIFDPEQSLSIEGDSGPYVQYALVRARSLLSAAKKEGLTSSRVDALEETETLERVLLHYPHVVWRASKELEPHYVTTYLTELASVFNSWYARERIIGGRYPSYALLLVGAFERTMAKGLTLLGIPTPQEM